jgi:hypothetical protein
VLVARNFKHCTILAVNHDGDSDSTDAITGNLLGTMFGVKAIPDEWLKPLELRGVITELAEDLYAFRGWEIGEYSHNKNWGRGSGASTRGSNANWSFNETMDSFPGTPLSVIFHAVPEFIWGSWSSSDRCREDGL